MRPPDNPYTSPSEETAWKVVKVFFVVVAIATVAGSFPRDLTGRNAVPSESLVVPAEVRPGRLETIAAKYAGRVIAVNAIVGQLVEANQVLMVLGSEELETADDRNDGDEEDAWRKQRHGDGSELLPAACSVELGRLVVVRWDVSQTGAENNHAEPE